jgi:hypothetical protein
VLQTAFFCIKLFICCVGFGYGAREIDANISWKNKQEN